MEWLNETAENFDLSITEAVETLKKEGFDVSTHKLRQYEQQKLLSPEKSQSKHRMYGDSDLQMIREILTLISLGFSIKKIRSFYELHDKALLITQHFLNHGQEIQGGNQGEESDAKKSLSILSRYMEFKTTILETLANRVAILENMKKNSRLSNGDIDVVAGVVERIVERLERSR